MKKEILSFDDALKIAKGCHGGICPSSIIRPIVQVDVDSITRKNTMDCMPVAIVNQGATQRRNIRSVHCKFNLIGYAVIITGNTAINRTFEKIMLVAVAQSKVLLGKNGGLLPLAESVCQSAISATLNSSPTIIKSSMSLSALLAPSLSVPTKR